MVTNKKVTVLMPVYNGATYLREAIDSILNQTYSDYNFLIINDGSNDETENIIRSYDDSRITYVENEENIGLTKTLNKGLDLIKSEYIVRMDADDISLPKRIERQVAFMDSNPEIAVSGTWIEKFSDKGYKQKSKKSCDSLQIKTLLLFRCALNGVIIRNSIIREIGYYDINHNAAEDYGLWLKMSFSYQLGNIPEVLYKYRMNMSGISQTAEKDVNERDLIHMKVYKLGFDHLAIKYSEKDLKRFRLFVTARAFANDQETKEIARVLVQLKKAIKKERYDVRTFEDVVAMYFRLGCAERSKTLRASVKVYNDYFSDIFEYRAMDQLRYLLRRYPIKWLKR